MRNRIRQLWSKSPKEVSHKLQLKLGLKQQTNFESHFWCLSTGRVGTTTLAALGGLVPEIASVHEPSPHLFGLGYQAYKGGSRPDNEVLEEAVASCRRDLTGLDQTIYLETSPQVTFLARQLLHVFPNSKFIHVVRHPSEVIRSGLHRKWYGGNATDQWRIEPRLDSKYSAEWSDWDSFEKNVWSWFETNRWIEEFLASIPESCCHYVKSEALFSGNEEIIEKYYRFLGYDVPPRDRIEKVLGKKLNSSSIKTELNSTNWSEKQLATLDAIAGVSMRKHGYYSGENF